MKTIHAHLRLSTNLTKNTRDRCPDVVFYRDDEEIAAIRTDIELPQLPLDDNSLDELILHDDVLSRSIDEEVWLRAFARVMTPGGTFRLTLPATGMLAWLDTMNSYRYLTDISGRGHPPDAALPTGWNRHYTQGEIHRLLEDAGFKSPEIRSQNYAMDELRLLAGLLRRNWITQDRLAESELFPKFGRRTPGEQSVLTTTWDITAIRR